MHQTCSRAQSESALFFRISRRRLDRLLNHRLRIEMLRAHLPAKFKQLGTANVKINASGGASVLVIGEAERDELVALRQQALAAIVERKRLALTAPVPEG